MLKDKDIREPLFEYLEEQFGRVRILEEKMMGRSRADVVAITPDELIGIEIKSDADTYVRLARQVRDYDLYFDRNYVVVGTSHAAHIEEHVPDYWGIITVEELQTDEEEELNGQQETEMPGHIENEPDFYMLREAKKNPHAQIARKLSALWRPELVHIQERYAMPRYKQQSKKFVAEKILLAVPEEALHKEISHELFERDYTTIREEITAFRRANATGKQKGKKLRAAKTKTNIRRLRKRGQ